MKTKLIVALVLLAGIFATSQAQAQFRRTIIETRPSYYYSYRVPSYRYRYSLGTIDDLTLLSLLQSRQVIQTPSASRLQLLLYLQGLQAPGAVNLTTIRDDETLRQLVIALLLSRLQQCPCTPVSPSDPQL